MKPVTGFSTDKLNQFIRIAELAPHAVATGQITAQCDQATDVMRLILLQNLTYRFAAAADAG